MTADTAGAVFPAETVLSDGSVYRVVPVSISITSPVGNEIARGEAQYFDEIADENDVPYIDIDNPDS